MRRPLAIWISLALTMAACSGGTSSETTTTTPIEPSTSVAEDSTASTGATDTTSAAPESTVTTSDRPLAPEFTLDLGGGGTFALADGEKPVYLVFWAEW